MKTTVVYHSADFDGIFCREIARKFLPDAELIGWNFGDKPLQIPSNAIYVLDLPLDEPFGFKYKKGDAGGPQHPPGLVWIDHHKSSIETHPADIPGYRIDGVAACRLAWFYFTAWNRYLAESTVAVGQKVNGGLGHQEWFQKHYPFAVKQDFVDRKVSEPLAILLAGEYDVWDSRSCDLEIGRSLSRAA